MPDYFHLSATPICTVICHFGNVIFHYICPKTECRVFILTFCHKIILHTVNSLMFAGINVCVFETIPCSWGIIFAVSSGLVNYLGSHELCLRVFMLQF